MSSKRIDELSVKENEDWVVLGRLGRPHGVKGLITVYSFTEPRENLTNYAWHVRLKNQWTRLNCLKVEEHTKHLVALIEGYQDREQVAELTNLEIAVKADELPELDAGEYYWHQLIGMTVVNLQGETLGQIIEVMPTGANEVLVVKGDKRYLIPYRYGAVVLEICAKKNQMIVDWDNEFI